MVHEDTSRYSSITRPYIFVNDSKAIPNTYSETDIIRMVEFLIYNIYVEFGGHV